MALRRWKPFLGAFHPIDEAIEAAAAGLSRAELRNERGRIVELLCDAVDGDGATAEGLCKLLDDAMAEALVTLRAVPAEQRPRMLESAVLVEAIGKLMRDHESGRVRGLARDVVRWWRAGAEEELSRAQAAVAVLDGLSPAPPHTANQAIPVEKEQPRPEKSAAKICGGGTRGMAASRRVHPPPPKKAIPTVEIGVPEEEKLEATKRKFRNAYQEADDAKRRRTIQVLKLDPPPPPLKKAIPTVKISVPEEEKLEATKRKFSKAYQDQEADDAKRRRTIQVLKLDPPPPPPRRKQRKTKVQPAVWARRSSSCAAERRSVSLPHRIKV